MIIFLTHLVGSMFWTSYALRVTNHQYIVGKLAAAYTYDLLTPCFANAAKPMNSGLACVAGPLQPICLLDPGNSGRSKFL